VFSKKAESTRSSRAHEALRSARERFALEIDQSSALPNQPIAADAWVVSSTLQKAIRRSEVEIAQRAVLTLFKLRGSGIWRRLTVIAFEDVGIGSIDAVTMTVAGGSDAAWRKTAGGDIRLAAHLARTLAEAPKDRSADYLVGAKDHPALAVFAQAMGNVPIEARLSSVRDNALTLQERAVATGFASRLGSPGEGAGSERDLDTLLASFRELGVPNDLVVATGIAAARTREPIVAMVPLIWLAADNGQEAKVCDCRVPPLVTASDVPLYALDEHTRLGREAIWRLACENSAVRLALSTLWRRAEAGAQSMSRLST
jgi:hypothetical protein